MRRHPDNLAGRPESEVPEGVCAWCLEKLPRGDDGVYGPVGCYGLSGPTVREARFYLVHEECFEEWDAWPTADGTALLCGSCQRPVDDVCLDCDRFFCSLCERVCPGCGFDTRSPSLYKKQSSSSF
jgi:hypothetical protein